MPLSSPNFLLDSVQVLNSLNKTDWWNEPLPSLREKRKEQQRTLDLRDSVRLVREKISALDDERMAYKAERDLLQQNRSFKGHDKTLTVAELRATQWLLYLAAATILLASLVALRKDDLKIRLAYSTISQLGYIILGAFLATSSGII